MFDALDRVRVREIMDEEIPGVEPGTFVEDLIPLMLRTGRTGFPVLENDRVVGIVTLSDVKEVPESRRSLVRVEDLMTRELVTVSPDAQASQALQTMQDEDIGRLLVTSGDRLEGVVTRQGVMQAFQVIQTMPRSELKDKGEEGMVDPERSRLAR